MVPGVIAKVLVANRGEIARRVFRTARRMGIATVAVYSEADAEGLHVRDADQAVLIGPAAARESYLAGERIIAAARATGADAIHPGYGFLSENAAFAQAVLDAGLTWIGPPPSAIKAMGLKDAAKRLMQDAGVPVTPGYLGEDQSAARLQAEADAIGYPVLIKAVAGGGGKGMRKVMQAQDFAAALLSCQREGAASFGDDRVLLETYVARPRHIEVQVFGDRMGEVVHLFERDCSLQRRHQKVLEEAPAPGMDAATRAFITGAAIRAAKAVDYVGAGTVEFIADASAGLSPDRIWFMEMNTRLQVEHPVTEAVTGLDLVEWQFRVASGEPLPLAQDQIRLNGWAIEARLYAEAPATGFLPSIGPLDHFRLPEKAVRVETGVEEGGEVSPFYDPMIAKLIARGADRAGALAALAEACKAVEVWPVKTNAGFLARCLENPDFIAGDVDTGFIPARLEMLAGTPAPSEAALAAAANAAAAVVAGDEAASPWTGLRGFRVNGAPERKATLFHDGAPMSAMASADGATTCSALVGPDDEIVVFDAGETFVFTTQAPASAAGEGAAGDGQVRAPMPGKIVALSAQAGQAVTRGQALLTLEAMKMEHALTAPHDGVVETVAVALGDQVNEGAVLVRLAALQAA